MLNELSNYEEGVAMKAIKNLRLQHYDYLSNGYYFVTIVTSYREALLTERREMINHALKHLETFSGVTLDRFVVMDDHVHLILVLNQCPFPLGEIVRRLKAITSKRAGIKLWQPNYYEYVIRHGIALQRIREYILENRLVERIKFEQFYEYQNEL